MAYYGLIFSLKVQLHSIASSRYICQHNFKYKPKYRLSLWYFICLLYVSANHKKKILPDLLRWLIIFLTFSSIEYPLGIITWWEGRENLYGSFTHKLKERKNRLSYCLYESTIFDGGFYYPWCKWRLTYFTCL